MRQGDLSKPLLERLPQYLDYLRNVPDEYSHNISSAAIARALGFGEVLVRKDLGLVSGAGKPRVGYVTDELIAQLEKTLNFRETNAVIIGAGKLGNALRDYGGFTEYGVRIVAAFDCDGEKINRADPKKSVYPMSELKNYCLYNNVGIAIITVPARRAQEVCDLAVSSGVGAIWNFAPVRLKVPESMPVKSENLASSLALLAGQLKTAQNDQPIQGGR